jgi:hypothetical protein
MDFKEYLGLNSINESEVYVNDDGIAFDDEGNSWVAGKEFAGETYGRSSKQWGSIYGHNTSSKRRSLSTLEDIKGFAMTKGVSNEDAERYWKEMKGNVGAVVNRIKHKSKKK